MLAIGWFGQGSPISIARISMQVLDDAFSENEDLRGVATEGDFDPMKRRDVLPARKFSLLVPIRLDADC